MWSQLPSWIVPALSLAGNAVALATALIARRDGRRARRTAHEARNIAAATRLRDQMDARRYGRRKGDHPVQRD